MAELLTWLSRLVVRSVEYRSADELVLHRTGSQTAGLCLHQQLLVRVVVDLHIVRDLVRWQSDSHGIVFTLRKTDLGGCKGREKIGEYGSCAMG